MYLLETHMHTSEGSRCGRSSAAEMMEEYGRKGYAGVVVTNHFYTQQTKVDPELSWSDRVEKYRDAFEIARKEGMRRGLTILFGIEFHVNYYDLLTLNITPEQFLKHPEFYNCSFTEYCDQIHAMGGYVVNAHPFREASYVPPRTCPPNHTHIDGVETFNGANGNPASINHNGKAHAFALQHGLAQTAGSDAHHVNMINSGIYFRTLPQTPAQFVDLLRRGEGVLCKSDREFR